MTPHANLYALTLVDEELLLEAMPAALAHTVGKPPRPRPFHALAHFLSSGPGVAVMAGIVAFGVLVAIVALGQGGAPVQIPPAVSETEEASIAVTEESPEETAAPDLPEETTVSAVPEPSLEASPVNLYAEIEFRENRPSLSDTYTAIRRRRLRSLTGEMEYACFEFSPAGAAIVAIHRENIRLLWYDYDANPFDFVFDAPDGTYYYDGESRILAEADGESYRICNGNGGLLAGEELAAAILCQRTREAEYRAAIEADIAMRLSWLDALLVDRVRYGACRFDNERSLLYLSVSHIGEHTAKAGYPLYTTVTDHDTYERLRLHMQANYGSGHEELSPPAAYAHLARFDEAFFAEHDLLLYYTVAPVNMYHGLGAVTQQEGYLQVHIRTLMRTGVDAAASSERLILVPIPKGLDPATIAITDATYLDPEAGTICDAALEGETLPTPPTATDPVVRRAEETYNRYCADGQSYTVKEYRRLRSLTGEMDYYYVYFLPAGEAIMACHGTELLVVQDVSRSDRQSNIGKIICKYGHGSLRYDGTAMIYDMVSATRFRSYDTGRSYLEGEALEETRRAQRLLEAAYRATMEAASAPEASGETDPSA